MILTALLTVLKIIGFALLGVFALILLITLLVLFIPIRYRLAAVKEGLGVPAVISLRLSWFLGCFRISYDSKNEGKKLRAVIFWFRRVGEGKTKKVKLKKDKTQQAKTPKTKPEIKETPKTSSLGSIKNILQTPDKGLIIKHTLKLFSRTFRALVPKRLWLSLTIGFDDPASTGLALGFLGILRALWGTRLEASGDFTGPALHFDLHAGDALALWSLTWPLLLFCVKRPIFKILLKYLKKDDDNEPDTKPNL